MLSKIYNLYRKKENPRAGEPYPNWNNNLEDFQARPSLPELGRDKIRVLVFSESVKKTDKTLLFDSDAIIITYNDGSGGGSAKGSPKAPNERLDPPDKGTDNKLGNSPPKYKRIKPNSDIKMLGEMIFGSVPLIYKGSIQKVHLINTPPQLMMTKVFALRSRSAGVNFCDNELITSSSVTPSVDIGFLSKSSIHSERGCESFKGHKRTHSNPTLRSKARRMSEMSNWSYTSGDSRNSSFDSPCGSLQRRFARSMMTSLDSTEILKTKTEQSEENRVAYRQQPKIAVGIIFKLWEADDDENNKLFQDFFFSHYTLFEAHLQTFRVKIEKSFYLKKNSTERYMTMLNATKTFKQDILNLCYSPRITEPVWLNLMTSPDDKQSGAVEHFVTTFVNLVKRCERKQTNFFLSILLSAVLTNHPSWVATVAPSGDTAKRFYLDKHSSDEVNMLAKCHPYNPLWAQLCDMYGSVNTPRKLSRTIVVGEDAGLVVQLLYLLTYFLRCSNVHENELQLEQERLDVVDAAPHSSDNYVSYASSWKEAIFGESDTPFTCSWVENVSCLDASEMVHESFCSSSNETIKLQQEETNPFCRDEVGRDVLEDSFDFSQCYCGYLQKLDTVIGHNNFVNLVKTANKDSLSHVLASIKDNHRLGGPRASNCKSAPVTKSCVDCRTLDYKKYCDSCDTLLDKLRLEVDSICNYCIVQIEKLSEVVHGCTDVDTLCHKLENETVFSSEKSFCRKKSSVNTFCVKRDSDCQCFACGQPQAGTCGLNNNNNIDINNCEPGLLTNNEPCSHKAPDPAQCPQSPDITCKLLRHSTTSHDSGTEMASSVTSSCPEMESADSMNLTQDNLVNSRDNLYNCDATATADLDSDYCSVENEHTSTVSEMTFESDSINTVCKSTSSSTLKETYVSLDSSTMNTIIDSAEDDASFLESELESLNLKQLPLPRTVQKPVRESKSDSSRRGLKNFGDSLLAGYCDSYVPDFVLHGAKKLNEEKLAINLQNSIKNSILDEQVYDASCVVANTDTWTCEVWNLARRTDVIDNNTCESLTRKPILPSALVSSMIESTKQLYDMDIPSKFCLIHLEEQLKDIYHRSKVLTEFERLNPKHDKSSIPKALNFHASDMDLLNAVRLAQTPVMI